MDQNLDNEQIRQEIASLKADVASLKSNGAATAAEESNGPAA